MVHGEHLRPGDVLSSHSLSDSALSYVEIGAKDTVSYKAQDRLVTTWSKRY